MTAPQSDAATFDEDEALGEALHEAIVQRGRHIADGVRQALMHPGGLADMVLVCTLPMEQMPPVIVAPRGIVAEAMLRLFPERASNTLAMCQHPAPKDHVRFIVYARRGEGAGVMGCTDVPMDVLAAALLAAHPEATA